jgi:PAS domain S-box-containing protein
VSGQTPTDDRYRIIAELTTDYAYSLRPEPDGTLSIEWVTDGFTRISGYSVEEAQSLGWTNIVAPEDLEAMEENVRSLLRGEDLTVELRLTTKDGVRLWIQSFDRSSRTAS